MTKKDSSSNDKKTGKRCTPKDLRVKGTFAEKGIEKAPPRPITKSEQHANNFSMVDEAKVIGSLLKWKNLYISELEEMNRNKVGRPYEYSDSLITAILSMMAFLNISFRAVSGLVSPLLEVIGLNAPSPSRLLERMNGLMEGKILPIDESIRKIYGEHVLALCVSNNVVDRIRRGGMDASGLSMSSVNTWRIKKWGTGPKDRGWLKIHVLCDIDSGEILAYAITDDSVGDGPMMKMLVNAAIKRGHRVDVIYADNGYCSNENWTFVHGLGKRFITSFKCNTKARSNGCLARGRAARLWCNLQYDEWVKATGYGMRWKVECVFSDLKRIFPENVTATSDAGILRQVISRVEIFNQYKAIRANKVGTTGNGIKISC